MSAKNKAIDLMPALSSAFAEMELPVLRDITQAELNRVRKVDGRVSDGEVGIHEDFLSSSDEIDSFYSQSNKEALRPV